jgi:hypothetical protein
MPGSSKTICSSTNRFQSARTRSPNGFIHRKSLNVFAGACLNAQDRKLREIVAMSGQSSAESNPVPTPAPLEATEGNEDKKPDSVMPPEDWLDEGLLETFPASDPLASGRIA